MPRIRKDSETLSNCGYSTISRTRRESDRLRNDLYAADNPNATVPRNISTSTMIREVYEKEKAIDLTLVFFLKKTKIYRLPQYNNQPSTVGSTPNENKSLLLASGKRDYLRLKV